MRKAVAGNTMTYLALRNKIVEWKKALIWAVLSAIMILLTYSNPPKNVHSAGYMAHYNFSFFLPMLGLSMVFGLISTIALQKFTNDWKSYDISYKVWRIFTVTVFLLPLLIHLIPIVNTAYPN